MQKISKLLAIFLLALLLASCASGGGSRTENWRDDEANIRLLIQNSMESWNRGDLTGHLGFYDQTVTFMTKDGPKPGVSAIEEQFKKNYFRDGKPIQSLRFEQVAVSPLARDAALATGRYVLYGGGKAEQSGWFTLVWVRGANGWRAVHDHSD